MSNLKKKTKKITEEELRKLYFDNNMSLDEIGKCFGYVDRQPILRLFKKFNIQSRSKSESANLRYNNKYKHITKEYLEEKLINNSVLSLSKELNIHRGALSKLMAHYGIKNEYFVNSKNKELILSDEFKFLSAKEISDKLNITIKEVKYYKKDFDPILYSQEEVKCKISQGEYDLDSRGFPKTLLNGDINLYNSIIHLTEDHILTSKKITERIYRIINDYDKDYINVCIHCKEPLKFYTYRMGYGNSEANICKNCIMTHSKFGVSMISQKLFGSIYSNLVIGPKDFCKYSDLNGEHIITIDRSIVNKIPKKFHEHLNKHKYLIDFVLNNKIIEFDGIYWHKNDIKDVARDEYLMESGFEIFRVKEEDYYNFPDRVLKECMDFLKQ